MRICGGLPQWPPPLLPSLESLELAIGVKDGDLLVQDVHTRLPAEPAATAPRRRPGLPSPRWTLLVAAAAHALQAPPMDQLLHCEHDAGLWSWVSPEGFVKGARYRPQR